MGEGEKLCPPSMGPCSVRGKWKKTPKGRRKDKNYTPEKDRFRRTAFLPALVPHRRQEPGGTKGRGGQHREKLGSQHLLRWRQNGRKVTGSILGAGLRQGRRQAERGPNLKGGGGVSQQEREIQNKKISRKNWGQGGASWVHQAAITKDEKKGILTSLSKEDTRGKERLRMVQGEYDTGHSLQAKLHSHDRPQRAKTKTRQTRDLKKNT